VIFCNLAAPDDPVSVPPLNQVKIITRDGTVLSQGSEGDTFVANETSIDRAGFMFVHSADKLLRVSPGEQHEVTVSDSAGTQSSDIFDISPNGSLAVAVTQTGPRILARHGDDFAFSSAVSEIPSDSLPIINDSGELFYSVGAPNGSPGAGAEIGVRSTDGSVTKADVSTLAGEIAYDYIFFDEFKLAEDGSLVGVVDFTKRDGAPGESVSVKLVPFRFDSRRGLISFPHAFKTEDYVADVDSRGNALYFEQNTKTLPASLYIRPDGSTIDLNALPGIAGQFIVRQASFDTFGRVLLLLQPADLPHEIRTATFEP
jgi:hypothetical protein